MEKQTIVAPMTPAGVSAVAALRVSGKLTKSVIAAMFGNENPVARRASYGTACHPQTGKAIDSLLYIFFEGPTSYTGEDTLEIFPHGNPLIVRELLQAILCVDGVRLAEPGEFTKRAFLNGKLDLVQAASVGDVIHSTSQSALENARRLLSGKFSETVHELARAVKDFSARIELDVDFAEEEADPDIDGWEERVLAIQKTVRRLLDNFRSAESMNRLPLVVVYGAPNAGKSSLINALLEEDRLLVSNVAGTTRDFVEVRLMLPGGEIRLVDTAGLAETPVSELDALSMEKSRKILNEASLKIHLVSLEERQKTEDGRNGKNDILVYSKADLRADAMPKDCLAISSKTGIGLEQLRLLLNEKLYPADSCLQEDFFVTSEREKRCLENAAEGLQRTLDLLRTNPAVELIAFEMQTVRRALQSITGEISSEDILQSIFAGFCIGK